MNKSFERNIIKNNSGFLAADFLFSFVLVVGCGIVIFALTFSLATVEIAQYITWSAARAYSSGNKTAADSKTAADAKFKNLSLKFPLLTRADGSSDWFLLTSTNVGDNAWTGMDGLTNSKNASKISALENRQPWTGVSATLEWKLFKSIKIPFLGKIAGSDTDVFTIPIRAFILRNPSQDECLKFFNKRFTDGIQGLESGWSSIGVSGSYVPIEDNGC